MEAEWCTNGAPAFGVRRLVAAFSAWPTCRPSSAAQSGATNCPNLPSAPKTDRLTAFDGDKSPAESGDKSPHSTGFAARRTSKLLLAFLFAVWLGSRFSSAQTSPSPAAANQVLELDGTNSCVILPDRLLEGVNELTVEGWIKWDRHGRAADSWSGQTHPPLLPPEAT